MLDRNSDLHSDLSQFRDRIEIGVSGHPSGGKGGGDLGGCQSTHFDMGQFHDLLLFLLRVRICFAESSFGVGWARGRLSSMA